MKKAAKDLEFEKAALVAGPDRPVKTRYRMMTCAVVAHRDEP